MQREKTTTFSDCSTTQKYHLHSDIHRPTVVAKLRVLIIFIASSMCLRLSYISLAALYQLAVTTTHNQIIHAPKCFFCDVMVDFHWHEIGWGESHWVGSWQQSLENKETQKFWISWECRSPLVLAPSHPISSHLVPSRPIFALQSPWDLGQHFGPWLHGNNQK